MGSPRGGPVFFGEAKPIHFWRSEKLDPGTLKFWYLDGWFKHTVDGSEIRRSPVEVDSLYRYL